MNAADTLAAGLQALALQLDAATQSQLLAFAALLLRWNRAFNLISKQDEARLVERHLLDSLSLLPHLRGPNVCDLGSGAGLPGIPLAIARPALTFTLVDRAGRRCRFLRQAAMELALPNIEVVQADLADYRPAQGFATLVSRALDTPARLWPQLQHLLAPGGRALLQAGPDSADAIFTGAAHSSFLSMQIPGVQRTHYLWVLDSAA